MSIRKSALLSCALLALAGGVALGAPAARSPAPKPAASVPPKPVGPLTLIMRGLDKITGRATTLLIPIGKSVDYATLTITARYCYTTPSTETPETVAFVQIDDHRPDQPAHRVFSGWMYASSPGLNGLQHPLYDAWVISCRPVAPGEEVVIGPAPSAKPVSPDAPDTNKPVALPEGASQ
ncbi:MAG TPA: DUF2155 domain-containing protein [Rhizomicrobium sp.]|nr:DUF2155 domain-containing protein [Rhizomicrobium sp.]